MNADTTPFRIAAVPGVTLTKWTRAWQQRLPGVPLEVIRSSAETQASVLRDDGTGAGVDVSFVRLPLADDSLSVIPLYSEIAMVVAPAEHELSLVESATLADLAGENVLDGEWAAAIDLVAAGVGVTIVPHSIARLHARKDVIARPVTDAADTRIAVAWVTAAEPQRLALIEEFVGIVRGRTARSSRSAVPSGPTETVATSAGGSPSKRAAPRKPRPSAAQDRSAANRRKRRGRG